jgi:hypothetical protein
MEVVGYDGFVYKNVQEDAGVDSYIAVNPSQIRSINAAFDPDFKESGVLLAQAPTPDYSGTQVTTIETIDETGEQVEITEAGDIAYTRTQARVQSLNDMINCLRG